MRGAGFTRVRLALAVAAALAVWPCAAAAAEAQAADPVALCQAWARSPGAGGSAVPSDIDAGTDAGMDGNPAMAAAAVESMLAANPDQVAAADRAIALLMGVVAADQRGEPGTPSSAPSSKPSDSKAAFCAAAGEAYRLGKGGSPYQARLLLVAGYRLAVAAKRDDLCALAAYRLGLLNLGGFAMGARGQRRTALRSGSPGGAVPAALAAAEESATPGCFAMDQRSMSVPGVALATVNALTCAIGQARSAGAFDTGAKASLRLARYWLDHGRRTPGELARSQQRAGRIALEALGGSARVPDAALRFDLMGRLADAAIDARASAEDPRLVEAVNTMAAGAADDRQRSQAAALRARIALAQGDGEAASRLLREAIYLESRGILPLRLPDWHLLLAQADPANRSDHLTAAFRALGSVRPLLPRFDGTTAESNFTLRVQPVYEALLADRLLVVGDGADDPVRIAEAQALVEDYRQAELQSVFGSECVAARTPIRPAELGPREVLLYPVLLPDRVLLIYAAGGAGADGAPPRYHLLAANRRYGRSDVIGLVSKMAESVSYGSDDSWRAPARQLYDILISPVAERLGPGSTLVVIPDGPLSTLPFAALLDAKGAFLIEQTNLGVVPSLAYSQPGAGLRGASTGVVAASLEKAVTLPVGTFPALSGTSEEARFAAAGYRRSAFIENFRRIDLEHALATRQTDVLHLATHASFNGRSDRSYIVADGEQIPITDLRGLIARNQLRGEQLDLLVLSACETAVGDDQSSLGLAGAAVQSGARSVLASLWQVNDAGTAQLMKAFYTGLAKGLSKSAALREAQLALIRQRDEISDPGVWAAFILIGGWR
ncbi:CHAT domain-containing protein [Novosphingobium sp. PASSN1]|uniref:CHAT domain-containing protein n=1 Tax=Novosphingobium sp. PASSN1 TaxID=2015561 RepID=UPI0025D1ECF3|nr:CHAT domain-containing protein [Novosphingobium sp. PASSN1]